MNMKVCALLIQLAVLYTVIPQTTSGGILDKFWDGVCKVFWTVVCPPVAVTHGVPANVAGPACHVGQLSTCKRTFTTDNTREVEYAFPDEFADYDRNGDGQIEYEEFVLILMNIIPMEQPEELRQPFDDTDINKNGRIDRNEWEKAPLIFKHPSDIGIESLRVDGSEPQLQDRRGYGYNRGMKKAKI